MNPLHVEINGAEILFNSLYDDPEPAHLMQDLFAAELPDGCFIDVGWYPQFDPAGRYKISILNADGLDMGTVFETRDVHQVVEVVQILAEGREDATDCWSATSSSGYDESQFVPDDATDCWSATSSSGYDESQFVPDDAFPSSNSNNFEHAAC